MREPWATRALCKRAQTKGSGRNLQKLSLVEFRGLALFKFLVMPRGMQDLRSLTRNGTRAHCIGSLNSVFLFLMELVSISTSIGRGTPS